jgi:hypothetical protein
MYLAKRENRYKEIPVPDILTGVGSGALGGGIIGALSGKGVEPHPLTPFLFAKRGNYCPLLVNGEGLFCQIFSFTKLYAD